MKQNVGVVNILVKTLKQTIQLVIFTNVFFVCKGLATHSVSIKLQAPLSSSVFEKRTIQENKEVKNLEFKCLNKWATEDGAVFCSHVITFAKAKLKDKEELLMPEVHSPDQGGPQTMEQALRICRGMGYYYARGFELKNSKTEILQILLSEEGASGRLFTKSGDFIESVVCEP